MKETDIPLKVPYLPPRLVTVAFKVEDAFQSGGTRLLDFLPSESNGLSGYRSAANENDFFGGDLSTSFSTSEYGQPNSSWEPF